MIFKNIFGTVDKYNIFRVSILKIRIVGFILLILIIIVGILSLGSKLYKFIGIQPMSLDIFDKNDLTITMNYSFGNEDLEDKFLLKNGNFLSTNNKISEEKIGIMLNTRIPLCEKYGFIDRMFSRTLVINPFLSMNIYTDNKHNKYSFYTNSDKYLLRVDEDFQESNGYLKQDIFICNIDKNDIFVKSVVNIITTK